MKEKELLTAVKVGNLGNVVEIIGQGVDVNYQDDDLNSIGFGWTALHYCIFKAAFYPEKSYLEIGKLLIQSGANSEAKNNHGETPVLFAVKYFSFDLIELLVKSGASLNALTNQGENVYDISLERYYYDQRLDLDHIGEEEDPAIKEAIRKGEGQSLQRLFKRIAVITHNGYDLNSGKFSAAFCTISEIEQNQLPASVLTYLFEKGANPNEYLGLNEDEKYPLFDEACSRKLPLNTLKAFAEKIGVNTIFAHPGNDITPLFLAVVHRNVELVESLVLSGADINFQNERLLRMASAFGDLQMVKYLAINHANILLQDRFEKTAIDYAEAGGFTEVADYLKSIVQRNQK